MKKKWYLVIFYLVMTLVMILINIALPDEEKFNWLVVFCSPILATILMYFFYKRLFGRY